eukprot:CAMPEP_0203669708 /NCGR_PEP_ID=MMETSP0090-20130426/6001_1 /ASSEMBLY_ACC=CAM_ASM_001088 /TAXON_ID=426623 /ORGANISM="Chaetoceros affinis, Strain CCMP159" /LENGTH=547 /DNA_ID=CAMNT_0050534443 /DNA_START=3 /DNA_END=1646 /DNA_ORIENTATION=-
MEMEMEMELAYHEQTQTQTPTLVASSSIPPPTRRSSRRIAMMMMTPDLAKSDDYIHTSTSTSTSSDQLMEISKRNESKRKKRKRAEAKKIDASAKQKSRKVKKRNPGQMKIKAAAKDTKKKKVRSPSPSPSPSKTKKQPKFILRSSDIAKLSPENPWVDLEVPPAELRPSATLTTGQCFNFIVVHDDSNDSDSNDTDQKRKQQQQSAWGTHNETEWIGPIQNLVLSIKETETTTLYRVLHCGTSSPSDDNDNDNDINIEDVTDFLRQYFQLETPLEPLYTKWSKNDRRLAKIAPCIPGLRLIRQDPIECIFSFICSSNNNIPRITKMLSTFRERYGQKLIDGIPMRTTEEGEGGGKSTNTHFMSIYSFPTLEELQSATEEELREMGLGYRAKYIIQTRDLLIANGGKDHLLSLRNSNDPNNVQQELLQYSGIGPKVADCVALFSLDQVDAIPVDVHVQHIASRDYDPSILGKAKSLTPTIYKKVGDLFRERFVYAGWAHSLLFVAELPSFRDVLPDDVVAEMDEWREAEMAKKAKEKKAKMKKKAKT